MYDAPGVRRPPTAVLNTWPRCARCSPPRFARSLEALASLGVNKPSFHTVFLPPFARSSSPCSLGGLKTKPAAISVLSLLRNSWLQWLQFDGYYSFRSLLCDCTLYFTSKLYCSNAEQTIKNRNAMVRMKMNNTTHVCQTRESMKY